MPYRFYTERRPTYLFVRVRGTNTPNTYARYFADVLTACEREDCHEVLIDECLAGPPLDPPEIYDIVARDTLPLWPVVTRMAYVDTNPDHLFERARFGETVARNRGLDVRSFPSLAEAEAWLDGEVIDRGT